MSLAPVAPDAPTGIGVLGPETHDFFFPDDDGEHRYVPEANGGTDR